MKFGKLLALMLPLVLVMVLAVACAEDEPAPAPAPAGITAEELQAAMAGIQIPEGLSEADVSKIVEGAAQPGISAAEVSKIISDQLAAQPGISAADLQSAVDSAVASAVADLPAPASGVTSEELQSAIAGIQIPEGLSEADVSKIVEGAAQPGISAAEVSKIISDQLAAQPGISAADLQRAVDSAVASAVAATVPAAIGTPAMAAPAPAMMGPPPESKNRAGTIVLRVPSVGPIQGINTIQGFTGAEAGITERLFTWRFRDDGSIDYEVPQLATEYELAPDLSKAVVKIREGVQFHQDWGEVTAEDVAWSFNIANPSITPHSITTSASVFSSFFGSNPVKAVDPNTIEITFNKFDVTWVSQVLSTGSRPAASMISKKVFDQLGEEEMKSNLIATGPLEIKSWAADEQGVLVPFAKHWSTKPQFDQLIMAAIPEEAVALAAMEVGEVDAGSMSLTSVQELVKAGFKTSTTGNAIQASLYFAGNNWETESALTGEPIDIPAMGVFVHDLAWIGNPHSPDDKNNPEGMDDMEQARLVRWALAMAIDRDTIIQQLTDGLAHPNYVAYIDPNSGHWKDKWLVPYDPAMAEEYLDKAGYPRGDDGVRFNFSIYTGMYSQFVMEVGDAVAGYFDSIGVKTASLHYPYAIYRPGLVGRTQTIPTLYHDDDGNSIYPHDKPKGLVNSTLTRGGYGVGYEVPELAQLYLTAAAESDTQKRNEIADDFIDFVHHWALQPGVLAEPVFGTYNPNSVMGWKQEPASKSISAFYNLIPVRR